MLSTLFGPIILLFSFLSCFNVPQEQATSITIDAGYVFPYAMNKPDQVQLLKKELKEISGLSMLGKKNLAAVQDEDGILYVLTKKGKIKKEHHFFAPGDYEGVEVVGDEIYVVKSSGKIFRITGLGKNKQNVTTYKNFLNKQANIEGLTYDKKNNRLLLAAKGKMADNDSFSRSIYAFDLKTQELLEEPIFTIDLNLIHSYLDSGEPIKYLEKITEKLDPAHGGFIFAPSGIAIHPITGNYYLISSVGKMLMILNPEGEIVHIEKLKKKVHQQPEGICFEPDGTLWVANEGKRSEAFLLRYKFKG